MKIGRIEFVKTYDAACTEVQEVEAVGSDRVYQVFADGGPIGSAYHIAHPDVKGDMMVFNADPVFYPLIGIKMRDAKTLAALAHQLNLDVPEERPTV